MKNFDNIRVLITGSGTGIGALLAKELARQGAEVIVTARRQAAADEVANAIIAEGNKAYAMTLDVNQTDSLPEFKQQLHTLAGPIDMLINNAGIVVGGNFEEVSLDDHLAIMQTNTLAPIAMTHLFMDDLAASERGHVVNVVSASAFLGLPWGSTYSASKWALLGFGESLRQEFQERGFKHLSVTSVCPSYIDTGMFDGVKSPLFTPMLTPEKVVASMVKGIQQKKALVIEPPIARGIGLLRNALPIPIWDRVAKFSGVSQSMRHWQGKKQ
ncbi:MAG TPA: SDR family NAD(P)-dependent oxidoreductase [Alcanivoracaceae bacterium]|nr:SDR family NAD(P)-dependent oxidoreductase [Alcanivoracaceae bacterium]